MNKIYRVIWNTQLGCWQAVSELAKNHNSSSQTSVTSAENDSSKSGLGKLFGSVLLFSFSLLPLSIHAAIVNNELPTGAQINSGSAQILQAGNTLNINQNSQNLSTNWNTFNIGQNATVNFNQPNQSSTAINHVLDSNASQIMGRLNANGQVFLLNPNGVVFSKTAQVNVGGLVASTLNLTDADIENGKFTLKGDPNSTATIENQGSIQTLKGGTVALIAPNVKNTGSIVTPNGTTHLTSASQVTLALQNGSLTQYQVNEGVLKGLVDNGGAIIAENGAIYLTAKAKDQLSKAVVNHTGLLEANRVSQNAKGEIILLGDMQTGETHVSGTLKAEGKNGVDGGFIETSAAHVEIDANTQVSTASDTAKSGLWLIDPVDITIDTAKATAIQTALNSGDVTVTTANSATNLWGANDTGAAKGDIHVNSAINWSTNQALTLKADNDININADITATGATGKLNLKYGQTTSNTNANYYLNNGAKVNLKAGDNFSTQKGTEAVKEYKVITSLGVAGSVTKTDLQGINGNLAGNYVLGTDIDASATASWNSGAGFNPIGNSSYYYDSSTGTYKYNYFTGVFEGLNHQINNLTINRPTTSYVGLFGYTNGANINNVGLQSLNINGYSSVGGLIGTSNNSNINNTFTTGSVTGENYAVGGLIGQVNSGIVENAYSAANVENKRNNDTGGLIGETSNAQIRNVYATGNVTNLASGNLHTAGLIGHMGSGNLSNAYATGKVTTLGTTGANGGLVAYNAGTISNSFWNTETTGLNNGMGSGTSAGVTGLTTAQMFNQSNLTGFDFGAVWGNGDNQTTPYLKNIAGNQQVYNKNDLPTGVITSTNKPALYTVILNVNQLQDMNKNLSGKYLLGNNIDASDTVNWNSGAGFNPLGNGLTAFTGVFDGLEHSINNLKINRPLTDYVGLIGSNNGDVKNIGLLEAKIEGQLYVGALAGYNKSSIVNSYAIGNVTGTANTSGSGVGGVIGSNTGLIRNTFSSGNVTAKSGDIGGLVGVNDGQGTIENSYSNSRVNGSNNSGAFNGGLVGWARTSMSKIINSYATGLVTGGGSRGGLVGQGSSQVINSFYNIETVGTSNTNVGGTGLTTAQMQNLSTFTNAGWDIDGIGGTGKIWRIYDGQTAPLLRSFLTQTTINPADQISTYNGQVQGLNTSIFTGLDSSKIYSSLSNSKNVGTYNLSYYSGQQGYDLIGNTINLIINKAVINAITGITANNKTYDGTTDATLNIGSADFAGMIAGDNLTVASSTGSFSDKNAGTDKTVNISGLSLGGADAGNYLLASTTATNIANITPATLTATITAQNKVYDAGTSAVVTYGDNRLGSDDLTVSGTANFSDKNVANGKTVTATSLSLNGADAHNYELVNSTAQTTADISKANINNITGITADNRAYNGLTAASLNSNDAQFNGMYAGDDLSVATATGQFDTATTGQAKTVSITGLSLGGADAQNYNLVDTTALTTADINMLTPANYLQAIQLRLPRYLPETNNALNTVDLDVRQGGVNTSGIQALTGEY
ncbi:YDG domain-containing protein [Acinetobacter sp. ANC 4862]|uniref:YDG domain-containing protein n=1 Tax=Acinetobacter sp. ANC 4862 TaxID=2529849 RepID=UPI00103D3632|nr:YDG domain-containing protein [Acinetobacter sp. ANC 4862]TCH65734.1 filamentous hemagglutinin N-terminal domain-containing protein [Acinetobacter sp. ANC 4862]